MQAIKSSVGAISLVLALSAMGIGSPIPTAKVLPTQTLTVSSKGTEIRFREQNISTIRVEDPDYISLSYINGDLCEIAANCKYNPATSFILKPATPPLLPPDPKSLSRGTAVKVVTEAGGRQKTYYFQAILENNLVTEKPLNRPSDPRLLANRLSEGMMWNRGEYHSNKRKWRAINTAIALLRKGQPLESAARASGIPLAEILNLIDLAEQKARIE